jgi:hypothetical protein
VHGPTRVVAGVVAGVLAVAVLAVGAPALAQEGDLDCGDPGTFHNMPVEIGNDPHGLDADGDGIGCEDPAAFGGAAPTDTTAPLADAPAADDGGTAPPATPVERQPSFTG